MNTDAEGRLVSRAMAYADAEQEPAWPLPVETWHSQQCPSHYADTANSSPVKEVVPGCASNAPGFLSRFVGNEGGASHRSGCLLQ